MIIEYASDKVKEYCTSVKSAQKLFGGNNELAVKLMSRINSLKAAETIHDIIVQPKFYFHDLHDKGNKRLEGYFSIVVKSKREPWRIILQPLDESNRPYDPCNIDKISQTVRIVEIKEVSKHYE